MKITLHPQVPFTSQPTNKSAAAVDGFKEYEEYLKTSKEKGFPPVLCINPHDLTVHFFDENNKKIFLDINPNVNFISDKTPDYIKSAWNELSSQEQNRLKRHMALPTIFTKTHKPEDLLTIRDNLFENPDSLENLINEKIALLTNQIPPTPDDLTFNKDLEIFQKLDFYLKKYKKELDSNQVST